MHRILWKLAYLVINPFRRTYWYVIKPNTRGVKCLLWWRGKVLLVRLSYAHKKWAIPGGGVKRKESFEEAVRREIKEELSIDLKNLKHFATYKNIMEHKRDTVACFESELLVPDFKIDELEIKEADWFSLDQLPEDRTQRVDQIISMLDQSVTKPEVGK